MALTALVVALTVGTATAVFGKPGDISVSVVGCTTAKISASGFDDVTAVTWSLDHTDRAGELTLDADGAAAVTIEPDLGPGSYTLLWQHPWRGASEREGAVTFTIPRCDQEDPTTSPPPIDEPTDGASPSETPTSSDTPNGEGQVLPTNTPTSFGTEWGSPERRRAMPVSGERITMGEMASLALVTLASAAAGVIVWRRRRPIPRHRRPSTWWS